jgi:hypothetical protein
MIDAALWIYGGIAVGMATGGCVSALRQPGWGAHRVQHITGAQWLEDFYSRNVDSRNVNPYEGFDDQDGRITEVIPAVDVVRRAASRW